MPAKKSQTRWLNPREMKAWRSYIIASRRLLEALETDLDGHDLSMADYEVMAQLSEAPGRRMRMSELAEVALVSRSRLSHRIKVLELEGWVERVRCSEDKRGLFAVLTSRGVKKISQIAPTYKACLKKRWLSQLSPTEQVQIEKIFSRINQAVSRSDLSLCDK